MLTLRDFQAQHAKWVTYNFPGRGDYWSFFGIVEELGELAHSHLKRIQGIRGTEAEHHAKAKDAIGDMLVFMSDYCTAQGYDLQDILEETWREVSQRDWIKYPTNGKDK